MGASFPNLHPFVISILHKGMHRSLSQNPNYDFFKMPMSILTVVSSTMPKEAVQTLRRTSHVVLLPPDPLLPTPVASHPDMLLFSLDDTLVVHKTYYSIAKKPIDTILSRTGLHLLLTSCPRGNVYPLDVGLNALVCGTHLFGKLDTLAPEVLSLAVTKGLTPVSVRQGYAGCSGLALGNGLMTADPSLAKAATALDISVWPAPYEDILLPGYDHGFIGGCGGVWQEQLFLCGTPTPTAWQHYFPSPLMQGKKITCLYKGPLFDCGGIRCFAIQ